MTSRDEIRRYWSEKQKRFRINNPAKNREYCKRWREANRVKHRESSLRNYHANKEKLMARTRKWHRDNAERRRIYRANYRKTNPAYNKLHCGNRRARKRVARICDSLAVAQIYKRAEWLRQWFDVVVDHIKPLSLGGTHEPRNLQIIYSFENRRKSNRLSYNPQVVFS